MCKRIISIPIWVFLLIAPLTACNLPAGSNPSSPSGPSPLSSTTNPTEDTHMNQDQQERCIPLIDPGCSFNTSSLPNENGEEDTDVLGCSVSPDGNISCLLGENEQANSADSPDNTNSVLPPVSEDNMSGNTGTSGEAPSDNNTDSSGNNNHNSGEPSNTDAFQSEKAYCEIILGGTWSGDSKNPCKVSIQTIKDRCSQMGGQWNADPQNPSCNLSTATLEDAQRKACETAGGVYNPIGDDGQPSCIVNNLIASNNAGSETTRENDSGEVVDMFAPNKEGGKAYCEKVLHGTWTGKFETGESLSELCKVDKQAGMKACKTIGGQWIEYDPDHPKEGPHCDTSNIPDEVLYKRVCNIAGGVYINPTGKDPVCIVSKSTASTNNAGNTSSSSDIDDIFSNSKAYCEKVFHGKWTGDYDNPCEMDKQTAMDVCNRIGGKWIEYDPDNPTWGSYCNTRDKTMSEFREMHRKMCQEAGGVFVPGSNSPSRDICLANLGSGAGTIVDLFEEEDKVVCEDVAGGTWHDDGNAIYCDMDEQTYKDICKKLGGKMVEAGENSYCDMSQVSDAQYMSRLCKLAGGIYIPNESKPVCIINKATASNNPNNVQDTIIMDCDVDSTAPDCTTVLESGGDTAIADPCLSNPDDPSCTATVDSDLQVDCDADPSACGSTTLDTGNTSDGDTVTIDPCVANPNDPACANSATVDSSLQVDCNADPSACGSITIDLGGGNNSSGGGTDGTINTVDCNANPTDPSCNTVVGP